jgi:membrane-bound serine protease (ClpP class)
VGPSGARARGLAYSLLRAAAVAGTAPKTRVGGTTGAVPPAPDPLRGRVVSGRVALQSGVVAVDAPTLGDFVVGLDGREVGDRRLDVPSTVVRSPGRPPQRRPAVEVRFAKPSLTGRLLHTVASPSVAYLLLVAGLLLIVLEFFTAGIGVAAGVGAACVVGACYGLAVVPARPWAGVLVAAAVGGFAIDLQAGAPRFWTAVGAVALAVGSVQLFPGPRPSALALFAGVVGTALFMVAGMPAMIRARFSTPTIGRESMVGEMGTALADVSPDGTVEIRGAQWRARTNRATPIAAGDAVRVVGIDGLLLEVEPEQGGAKDARH